MHDNEGSRDNDRNTQRDDRAGAPPQREEADQQYNHDRLGKRSCKFVDRAGDDFRLVGDLTDLQSYRQIIFILRDRLRQFIAEIQNVPARRHGDRNADGFFTVEHHDRILRIGVRLLDGRDITETNGAFTHVNGQILNGFRGI